ncbi:hypothetical protein ASPCAL13885 [Aspergillus calidoustus]|uniref:Uncharacterized protein n=1 Tax=Aspergillus calidoustus TaxID=454130 RepID=A0A0U5GG81_ASPCI|nr:hypothetical protein ASPCAL13885 [Aspergillus calidoustus]
MGTPQQPPKSKPQARVNPTPHIRPPPPPPKDIRQTKAYKTAARRWTTTIVALPILFYTSWVLFERTYGDKQPKRLAGVPGKGDEEK